MLRTIAIAILLSLLSGCASSPDGRPNLAAYPAKGQTAAQQERDTSECLTWAQQQSGYNPMSDTAKGAGIGGLVGAIGGAAAGAAVGAATGNVGKGAAIGAAAGGITGAGVGVAYKYTKSKEGHDRAFATCMSARGYSTPGNPVVTAPAPAADTKSPAPPVPTAPAVMQPAPKPAVAAGPAAAATPPAKSGQRQVVFRDDFGGKDLAEHWEIRNPKPDHFIVQDGKLLLIGKAVGALRNKTSPNIFKLNQPLPSGDWVVAVKFNAELQTGRDEVSFGMYTDEKNMVVVRFFGQNDVCCYESALFLNVEKIADGERTFFSRLAWPKGTNDYAQYVKGVRMPITLRLIKEGRTFRGAVHFDGQKDKAGAPLWHETDVVTTLRAPRDLVFNVGQWAATNGESLIYLDEVTIEKTGD